MNRIETFKSASFQFELSNRIVQVWAMSTTSPDSTIARFYEFLSPQEKNRAHRFRIDHLQREFIITRGTLRTLLGHYLNSEPTNIQLSYGPRGKPRIAGAANIDFNVSHSANIALFAFTRDCEVGIDIEKICPLTDMYNIANRYFTAEETSQLMRIPANQREHAFYLCWTRKEAFIKAIGDGLSVRLDSFRVTFDPKEQARLILNERNEHDAKTWTLADLKFSTEFAAALAYCDATRPIRVASLDPRTLFGQ
jgi:4'-phosphopantetheinyl transferase